MVGDIKLEGWPPPGGLNSVHGAFDGTVASQDVAVSFMQKVFAEVHWDIQQIPGVALVHCLDPKLPMNVGSEVRFQLLHGVTTVGRQERWPPSRSSEFIKCLDFRIQSMLVG